MGSITRRQTSVWTRIIENSPSVAHGGRCNVDLPHRVGKHPSDIQRLRKGQEKPNNKKGPLRER